MKKPKRLRVLSGVASVAMLASYLLPLGDLAPVLTAKADDDCRLVTYTEAAKRLNLSRPTVYRLVKLGRLEVVPLDGVNRIRLKSVVDFANGTTR